MADRFSRPPTSREAASAEARQATAALFARIAADRRRSRRRKPALRRDVVVDLMVAMSTYVGITVAMILGAIYGLRAVAGLLVK